MVSWSRAWSAAFAWLAWTLLFGVVGIAIMIWGFSVVSGSSLSLGTLVSSGYLNLNLLGGFILIVIGWIIVVLAAVASFFKINSEVVAEEVQSNE